MNKPQKSTATVNPSQTPVPLLNINGQNAALKNEIDAAIARVCQSGQFVLGPDCRALEEEVAQYCQTKHAIGCASGSDALLLALMALELGPGDEVLMPSYTFFATAGAVWRIGAKPVFVDIDPITYQMDCGELESKITPSTKAVIPVHLFGACVEMQTLNQIAEKHQIPVIEDACQSIGAEFQGQRAGSMGIAGCFSFYPTKNLGSFGDAGMLTTNDDDFAKRLSLLRCHGMEPRYYHQIAGINSRLDSIQAAVLRVKLKYLDSWSDRRAENAKRYAALFAEAGLDKVLTLPVMPADQSKAKERHVWNQYVIRVPDGRRDQLRSYLTEQKIGSEIYYPVPLHAQQCFNSLGYTAGSLPQTERAADETLALPIYPELPQSQQERVVEVIGKFFTAAASQAA